MAAHPGVAVTELVAHGPGLDSEARRRWASMREHFQAAAQGPLPTLCAATASEARVGTYYGPTGPQEVNGPLGLATIPTVARDAATADRLWTVTEELTSTRFPSRAGCPLCAKPTTIAAETSAQRGEAQPAHCSTCQNRLEGPILFRIQTLSLRQTRDASNWSCP